MVNDEPLAVDIANAVQPHVNGNIKEIITIVVFEPPEGGLHCTVVGCYDAPVEAKRALLSEAASLIV